MNEKNDPSRFLAVSDEDRELVDRYLSNLASEEEVADLEKRLQQESLLREFFAEYSFLVSNLELAARSDGISRKVLASIDTEPTSSRSTSSWTRYAAVGLSLALLVGVALGVLFARNQNRPAAQPVAWLVNAHACQWQNGFEPTKEMVHGDRLQLAEGVAQLRFACGADVLLQGPAEILLLSDTSAELKSGKVSVKVPKGMKGFEIFSPQGRILDLGTEFGVSVGADGQTEVLVFDGEVEAFAGQNPEQAVKLKQSQSAAITSDRVDTSAPHKSHYVRAIADAKNAGQAVPVTHRILFDGSATDGIRDQNDRPIGFDYRLPGTGAKLATQDPNLLLDVDNKELQMTITHSDINGQKRLELGEYLGCKLSRYGFTGEEDFSVSVDSTNVPNLKDFGQFGLYVGSRSDRNIRGGIIKWGWGDGTPNNTVFMTKNNGLKDFDSNSVGLLRPGDNLKLTMSRIKGKYQLMIENYSLGTTTTLTVPHPEFLDPLKDLHVGLFVANPFTDIPKTVKVSKFEVTIWKKPD